MPWVQFMVMSSLGFTYMPYLCFDTILSRLSRMMPDNNFLPAALAIPSPYFIGPNRNPHNDYLLSPVSFHPCDILASTHSDAILAFSLYVVPSA